MTISAKVIADSVNPEGIRITTMQITLHRFVLAEFNTHRVFSRNFRSSRAVPVAKLISEVRTSPAEPVVWRANKPGMQGGDELVGDALAAVQAEWRRAASDAADRAAAMMDAGLHKSWANRVLEPFLYVHGIVTSTEWHNFYALRCHPDAQPEMRELAEKMQAAQDASTPFTLTPGSHCPWHLPYVTIDEWKNNSFDHLVKLSVARCARVSYLTQDGRKPSVTEDLALYDRLVGAVPAHASPAEHQATPDAPHPHQRAWAHPELHGNFFGWIQYRKLLEEEQALKMAMPEKLP